MPQTSMFKYDTPDDSDPAEMDVAIASAVQSIEDNSPIQYVSSIAALKALSGSMYVNGMQAVLTANDAGAQAGCSFVRAGSKWLFASGTLSNLSTFVGNVGTNFGTLAGATCYAIDSSTARVFTNTTGNSETLIGGNTWVNIAYKSGYQNTTYGDHLSYRLTPGGAQISGHIMKSSGQAIRSGTVIGNIPDVAKPSNGQYIVCRGGGASLGAILIQADGDIILQMPIGRTSNWYSLDNVFLSRV